MLIDCDTCTARPTACGDCVISAMLGGPPGTVADPPGHWELDDAEARAFQTLAEAGLVPPLRLVPVIVRSRPRSA